MADMTDAEFRTLLKEINRDVTLLVTLAGLVCKLKKNEHYEYKGKRVTKKDVRSLLTQVKNKVKGLAGPYKSHGKRKKTTRRTEPGRRSGFENPILVNDSLRQFLSSVNLGPSEPWNPSSTPLNRILAVGQSGVTSRAILTPTLVIYSAVNNMQQDPKNKQYLTATPEMDRHLGSSYPVVVQRERQKRADMEVKLREDPTNEKLRAKVERAQKTPVFDPKHFRYASFQSIVAANEIPKSTLSAQQKGELDSDTYKQRLGQEQAIVSKANAWYKWEKKGRPGVFETWYAGELAKKAAKKLA